MPPAKIHPAVPDHLRQGSHRHRSWAKLPLEITRRAGTLSKRARKPTGSGGLKASTLWEIDNPRKSETGHSAQKPVECMQRAIHNHRGDVYDPFVGSGTTVIAGEQEGRTVYALEIEPAYVDVTVRRWEDFTGQKSIQVTTP